VGTIYGPGGVGKTFLLNACLQQTHEVSLDDWVQIRVDGRKDIRSLEVLFGEEIPTSVFVQGGLRPESCPGLLAVGEAARWMMQKAEAELTKEYAESPALLQQLLYVLSFGLLPKRAIPRRPYDLSLLQMTERELEQVVDLVVGTRTFRQEREWLSWGRKRRGRAMRNALRRDVFDVLVDELMADLTRLFRHSALAGKQLLWIFDDYESIEPLVGDFLVTHLVERLEKAPFRTLLLFLGRDNLLSTHTAWGQHHRDLLGERMIELKPFQEQEAYELMRKKGLYETELCERIWQDTQGFPFLLDIECEDAVAGGRSALGLKLFFDRLTRWMTPIQKEWIVPLSFLDEINVETVASMLPGHDASAVLEWFKVEPAIRDPHASVWQVLPFVRNRIQQYVKNDSPHQYRELKSAAKQVALSMQE
jgi:hypothetical protein